jgi:hypothetical protein
MRVCIALLVLALAVPRSGAAQLLDPDTCWSCRDTYAHAVAGAGINLAVRSGIIAESWRTSPVKRVGLVLLIGAAYEGVETLAAWENGQLGERGFGFGLKDLAADVAGALVVELGDLVLRTIF